MRMVSVLYPENRFFPKLLVELYGVVSASVVSD